MQSILDHSQTVSVDLNSLQQEAQTLFKAVTEGDLAQVKQLLPVTTNESTDKNAATPTATSLTVNVADSAGFTPLMIAARLGHEEIVQYLLTHPQIDLNATSEHGNTAFLFAAAKKSVNICRALLEAGANYFHTNANQDTCLMYAAISGNGAVWSYLLGVYDEICSTKQQKHKLIAIAKRFLTLKNDEGLTILMCAVMGGNFEIVQQVIDVVRRELGINLPKSSCPPSARRLFYPSIYESALGSSGFTKSTGYVDPAPPVFLAYVDATNLMGDSALHIAAQNQALDLYLYLVENCGADPMKINRRNRRTFELFQKADQKAKSSAIQIEEITDSTSTSDSSSSSTSTTASVTAVDPSETAREMVEAILTFQRSLREQFLEQEKIAAEKRFSELMLEEEEALLGGGKKKKNKGGNSTSTTADKKAKKKAKKSTTSTFTTTNDSIPAEDEVVTPVDDSDGETVESKTKTTNAVAAPATSSSPILPTPLSKAAPPFVPLAELAAIDAATGWETVSSKPIKRKDIVTTATTMSTVQSSPTTAARKSTKKDATASGPMKKKKTKKQVDPIKEQSTPSATPSALVTSASPVLKASDAGVKPTTTLPAPIEPSSPFFAAFGAQHATTTRKAWRPILAASKQPTATSSSSTQPHSNSSTVVANAASSSATSSSPTNLPLDSATATLATLQSMFTSLHPHIDSTDLQLSHFLGHHWSSLSLSQLSCLEEIYSNFGRQIRETQFSIFQQQQQEIMSELVRTKSEVHALRREVAKNAKQEEDTTN